MLSTILIVLLILLLIGALPTWPYSASWAMDLAVCSVRSL